MLSRSCTTTFYRIGTIQNIYNMVSDTVSAAVISAVQESLASHELYPSQGFVGVDT
jgi:hypothetical protein